MGSMRQAVGFNNYRALLAWETSIGDRCGSIQAQGASAVDLPLAVSRDPWNFPDCITGTRKVTSDLDIADLVFPPFSTQAYRSGALHHRIPYHLQTSSCSVVNMQSNWPTLNRT